MKYCIAKLTLVQSSDVYDYEQEGPPQGPLDSHNPQGIFSF